MGIGEAKELICMTHGHELRVGGAGWRGIKGVKWDNCNSIINKIFKNLSKLVSFCVAFLILKMGENIQHIWHIILYYFKKGKTTIKIQK